MCCLTVDYGVFMKRSQSKPLNNWLLASDYIASWPLTNKVIQTYLGLWANAMRRATTKNNRQQQRVVTSSRSFDALKRCQLTMEIVMSDWMVLEWRDLLARANGKRILGIGTIVRVASFTLSTWRRYLLIYFDLFLFMLIIFNRLSRLSWNNIRGTSSWGIWDFRWYGFYHDSWPKGNTRPIELVTWAFAAKSCNRTKPRVSAVELTPAKEEQCINPLRITRFKRMPR